MKCRYVRYADVFLNCKLSVLRVLCTSRTGLDDGFQLLTQMSGYWTTNVECKMLYGRLNSDMPDDGLKLGARGARLTCMEGVGCWECHVQVPCSSSILALVLTR